MNKILLIHIMLFSSLMAEQGHKQGIANDKKKACSIAKEAARAEYHVFQMNSGCKCQNTDTKEWICEILFSYMSEKKKR